MPEREDRLRQLLSQRQGTQPEPANAFPLSGGQAPSLTFNVPETRATQTSFSPRGVSGEIFDPALEISKKVAEGSFGTAEGLAMTLDLFDMGDRLIPAPDDPASAVVKGISRKIGRTGVGRLLGFDDEDALAYNNIKETFGTLIARAFGEKGVVTNQDVSRVLNAFPKENDSAQSRQTQREFMQTFLQNKIGRFNRLADIIGQRGGNRQIQLRDGRQNG